MCASYGLQGSVAALADEYALDEKAVDRENLSCWMREWAGDKNITTTRKGGANLSPVVRETSHGRRLDLSWWWLWVAGAPAKALAFNARSDRLLSSNLWSGPYRSRRALVPATRYFEKKWRFDRGGDLFGMAAIYNLTKLGDQWLVSYTIVTHDPIDRFAEVHDRQPLLVPRHLYDDWLNPERAGDPALLDQAVSASREYSEHFRMSPPE